MASIAKEPNGHRRILFVAPDGNRKTIRLGKIDQRSAETICRHVESLLSAKITGQPVGRETAVWLAEIGTILREKLARVGLVESTETRESLTLGEHLDNYFTKRNDVKESTRIQWGNARTNLLAFFGADRLLESITPGDAKDFERWLRHGGARRQGYIDQAAEDGLAFNTARKRISTSKQFFEDAVEREILLKNPFAALKGKVGSNRARDYFITLEESARVIEACPNAEWRLLFALSRFGGLRCPSEHLALTWADVDWERNRLTVWSPKTAHHDGKESRQLPIFPELRPYLEAVWEEAEAHTVHVITRYRDSTQNLRTQLNRIIRRAGLTPWGKLWQNLRATRSTELTAVYPGHVVAAWMGHSPETAHKHYLQVTDEDFDRAAQEKPTGYRFEKAAQNPAQQTHAGGRKDEKTKILDHPAHIHNSLSFNDLRHDSAIGVGRPGTRTPTPLGTRS